MQVLETVLYVQFQSGIDAVHLYVRSVSFSHSSHHTETMDVLTKPGIIIQDIVQKAIHGTGHVNGLLQCIFITKIKIIMNLLTFICVM